MADHRQSTSGILIPPNNQDNQRPMGAGHLLFMQRQYGLSPNANNVQASCIFKICTPSTRAATQTLSAPRGPPSPHPNLTKPDLHPRCEKHRTRRYSSVALPCFELQCVGQHVLSCSFWSRPLLAVPLPPRTLIIVQFSGRDRRTKAPRGGIVPGAGARSIGRRGEEGDHQENRRRGDGETGEGRRDGQQRHGAGHHAAWRVAAMLGRTRRGWRVSD